MYGVGYGFSDRTRDYLLDITRGMTYEQEQAEYESQAMYDAMGEDYEGQRYGCDGWGPCSCGG